MNPTQAEFHILLIEDSRADAKIIERALRESEVVHKLTVIRDGPLALDYLFNLRRKLAADLVRDRASVCWSVFSIGSPWIARVLGVSGS